MTSTTPVTPGIDPRLRARRIAVQRDQVRRRLRRLAYVGAAAGVVAAGWGLAHTPLLDVDRFEVRGAGHTPAAEVASASGIHRGDALLTADVGAAARALSLLPWVETATVRRSWPGTVTVDIVERRPVAAIPAREGGWILVDLTARQLALVPEVPAGTARVDGTPSPVHLGQTLPKVAGALALAASRPAVLGDRLVGLQADPGGTVEGSVVLGRGADRRSTATVLFGRPTQLEAKWLALLTVLEKVDPVRLVSIDLRVPSAPVLTRR